MSCSHPVPTAASYRFGPFVVDGGAYRLLRDGAERAAVAQDHRPAAVSRGAAVGARLEGRSVQGAVARRRGHRQRADAGGVRAAAGARRRPVEARRTCRPSRGAATGSSPPSSRLRPATAAAGAAARAAAAPPACRRSRCSTSPTSAATRAGLAVVGHRRDGDQRSARGDAAHHRSRARSSKRSARSGATSSALRAELHRPRRRRQLSARRRPPAHHRAHRRCRDRRVPGRRQGRRAARAGVRAAGPDRVAVRRGAGAGRPGPAERRHYRETSSLEAYQAFTEGRVRLESLDAAVVPAAIADFERAIALDPRYAAAHVGLANARFWQYQMSRARNQPDGALLARAIDHVRRAIELERDLADAHATLSFLLVSAGRSAEALAAARRAVALEPGYWGNQFRLAHAAWGEERLQALGRAMELYPDFPFAHFEAAMVHIARGTLDRAEPVLREGTIVQDRQANLQAALSGEGPALAARPGAAGARRRRGSAARVRPRDRLRRRAAVRAGVRDERARRRRVRAPGDRRRPMPPSRDSAARSSCFPITRARSSGLGAALRARRRPRRRRCRVRPRHGRDRSAAPRRPRRRSRDRRSVPCSPSGTSETRPCSRCTACSTRRSRRSPAGPSRSSRCSTG